MKLRLQPSRFFWSMVLPLAFLVLNGFAGEGSQLVARLKAGKPQTILTYGTSLTAGGAWIGQLQAVLKSKYPGLATVINSGQGAMWSKWGVDHLDERVLQKKPDAVFIEFAINDAYLEYQTSVEDGRKNLENMIARILQVNAGCEIILMTMDPPVGVHLERRPKVAEYYQMYRDVAKEQKLMLIDHYRNWEIVRGTDEKLYAKYVPDGIHPNTEGCAKVTTPAILEALGLATDADFRPAIMRIELDRERVCAGKSLQMRMDWQVNAATRRDYQLTLNLVGIGRPPDFSTNIALQPPTTQWRAGALVRGEDFVISIPSNLSPGWRRMLFSLTQASAPSQPIPLDNADRHERNSQYCFGEIEILPAGSNVPSEPVVRWPTNDPAKPERPNEEWRMRHGERVAEVQSPSNALEVLFIGDSITGGWLNIGKAVWEKEFFFLRAVNIGIAGSQTSHILWQFENRAIDGMDPRVAVLMIGVNNVMAAPSQSAADIARGISVIVTKLREKLPHTKVLLLGTFPKDRSASSPDRRKIQELNAIIAKLDDGNWIRFLDISGRLLDKDGNLTAEISPDGVHLTENGYQKWAEAIRPIVGEMTAQQPSQNAPPVLTPKPPLKPRINAPSVFGVRPGAPFLYAIPATGDRPMEFGVENLPKGLSVNPATGRITGSLKTRGEHIVFLKARNAKGTAEKKFRIVAADRITLTPPMGWNSWNCWADSVSQEKVLRSARAIVNSGLIHHGWSYVNIDDTWQGVRGGDHHAIQPNEKFPEMKRLCAEIHALGLKAGIYSTPWVTSYAKHIGGSSDRPDGGWTKDLASEKHWRLGKHSFAEDDARQWAEWGFDYLKYDWNPNDIPHVREMSRALRKTGRDIVFSLSNSGPFADAAQLAELANCWRTTGDIWDYWDKTDNDWRYGVSELGFSQDRWAPYAGPGHWNDPDMLVVGWVGWGPQLHRTNLTPDEQYAHISLWCLLSAPLLIGCDLERLDDFTLGLLTNDEVLALDQDALGRQAVRIATYGAIDIYKKELEDGGWALGFFNRGDKQQEVLFNKLGRIGIPGRLRVRDLWRQKDLPPSDGSLTVTVAAHGVVLLKLRAG